jgi:hypothetical protein
VKGGEAAVFEAANDNVSEDESAEDAEKDVLVPGGEVDVGGVLAGGFDSGRHAREG